ncbi:MAG: hypothetical protein EBS64_05090 [Verrucomicrobia bacterium]|nr:hypothetical protein [Verrucomicrobiota bacterium]
MIEQHPRSRLRFGIVIETVHPRFRREIGGGVPSCDIQAQQVSDGLPVFEAVEPTQDGMSCRALETQRGLADGFCYRIHGREQLRRRRLFLFLRWHFALVQLVKDFLPY